MSIALDGESVDERTSIFQSSLSLEAKLERARMELLDLSARNRLLNIPRSAKSTKSLEVADEQSKEVYRLLVRDQRPFTFLPGKAAPTKGGIDEPEAEEIVELAQPDDDGFDERGVANRHADTKLQTRLTPAGLQKRLLDLYHDARTLEEEQGVNILFLALGTLKWIDPKNAANVRYAPLVLVPVALERGNAAEKFKLRWRQEDTAPNLSLEAYLDQVHSLKLPTFEPGDDFDLSSYCAAVSEAITSKQGWSVAEDDIVLGFFSFAKFLMYRDLDPGLWPANAKLGDHALIRPLVSDGFAEDPLLLAEDAPIDAYIAPSEMVHIVDSDSSQTLAVHEVRQGRNLVIQGPPGTGKSQTIANIIATAVADGKTVLFVAEKMAALEVVKRRLDNAGVGDACLELHSSKANKRAVLEDLRRTWELGTPRDDGLGTLAARLTDARDELNAHAEHLHALIGAAGFTPYQVIGHLVRLKQLGQAPTDVKLERPENWSAEDLRERTALVMELAERVVDIGVPSQHVWRGVQREMALPSDVDRLSARISDLCACLRAMDRLEAELAAILEVEPPSTLTALDSLGALAHRIADAPDLEPAALGAPQWRAQTAEIAALLARGGQYAALSRQLEMVFAPQAWSADLDLMRKTLNPLPGNLSLDAFERAEALVERIPNFLTEAQQLATALGREAVPTNLRGLDELVRIGDRVAAAPHADPQAFASDLWDSGVERAADLAAAVQTLESARVEIGSALSDAAWDFDLGPARRILAAHGKGILRIFSREWRAANRQVRSFLADPRATLEHRLGWLDALGRGQAAVEIVKDGAEFGHSAFGADWHGERSAAAPLLALVEWMRSLRGLGAEPRLIAHRQPDREAVGALVQRATEIGRSVKGPLIRAWSDLGDARSLVFGDAVSFDLSALMPVLNGLTQLRDAHRLYVALTWDVDPDLNRRRENLNQLAEGQHAAAAVSDCAALGMSVFGDQWRGLGSDWPALLSAANWIGQNLDVHQLASRIADRGEAAARADAVLEERTRFLTALGALLTDLHADTNAAVVLDHAPNQPRGQLRERLALWRDHSEDLSKWVAYRARARRADASGLSDLVLRLHDGTLPPEQALNHFEMSFFEVAFAVQVHAAPALAQFDGDLHSRTVRAFVDLDRQRIQQAALEVVRAHHRVIPPRAGGALGPLGVLKGEMARKRGHMPIRQLVQKAAQPIQALKPVFMMSPLSVAQFLPPGALTFDLLVMDEASQILPVDALGAIARCRQVVVVGDPQQLPPTAFFAKMTGGGEGADDDDTAARVADIESILGLFTARGLPMRMLRWHYRSRHQSLIAVSNRQFYDNKLYIVPSPYSAESGMGLRFHHVTDGIFETGTTRTNPVEAKSVARAIVDHAITYPDQSLGVVAFSAAQRRAILDQLELLRRTLPPEREAFFQAHPAEPFFIKNLENVQGDERDVIFISVGYGPTALGLKPPMRFGPLGQEGGERRLNVLISRAKRRCEIFASMTDEDIDPDFASTRKGVFAFRLFMHFARTGRMALAESLSQDRDEVFETAVAQALHARGYVVHRKVGISGIFVDIAISDPDRPDRYLLAVECDGEGYRGARSARDRNRLRQAVLEDHGWVVHRLWSADWLRRPNQQLDRIAAAIEAAKIELASRGERDARRPAPARHEIQSVEREEVTEIGLASLAEAQPSSIAYVEAILSKPSHLTCELHEAPTGILTLLAQQVVAIEGPVHIDEIIDRVRNAWGLKRAGSRIQDAVERAVTLSIRLHQMVREGDFYAMPGSEPQVRDRSAAQSPTLRKPEALPPAEIGVALVDIVSRNFGATEDQAIQAVSRALGFKATSTQLRDIIADVLQDQLNSEKLVRRGTLIDVGPNAPVRDRRVPEPTLLERLIAEGEHSRLEFKESLRWDVRRQVEYKKLEDVVIKTIAALANQDGGTLLIGVSDNGTVVGVEPDLALCEGSRDKFEVQLTNLLNARFSPAFTATKVRVGFPSHGDKLVCRVDVQRSRRPIYVKLPDQSGAVAERLFCRNGNASHEIPPSQIADFVKEHFV
jgi:very-short-patch-repair endonuclease